MFNNNIFITEKNTQNWSNMIKEEFGVEDKNKLSWVSQVAAIHEAYEGSTLGVNGGVGIPNASAGVSPIYATPLNTTGMGNPAAPSNPDPNQYTGLNLYAQQPGSGDIPMSTMPMALNVALMTIGLELVPVVPARGPWHLLTYLDFPYAGGKLGVARNLTSLDGKGKGNENKPLYVKFLVKDGADTVANFKKAMKTLAADDTKTTAVTITDGTVTFKGVAKQWGRMDGGLIVEVKSCTDANGDAAIMDLYTSGTDVTVTFDDDNSTGIISDKVDFVQTSVDLIDGFANFATGKKEPMTRAQNETGTGNTIGLRIFSKWVEMGSYEATGTVTRQQLQDLPLYGIDAVSDIMQAMQNEITQHINQRILDSLFKLGVTNAVNQKHFQGLDLNLNFDTTTGTAGKDLADFAGIREFVDVAGNDMTGAFTGVKLALMNTSAENFHTIQRRISSRILYAANVIAQTGRRGRGTFVVTNTTVATALQDVSGYVVAPMANTMSQTADSLWHAGSLGGLQVYVDPYMDADDCRVLVGRKGSVKEPGLMFLPYILADKVKIVAEGTMADKLLINSRFAIVPVGFYPEAQYLTFCVDAGGQPII
jgi:hypothetical protein